MPEGTTLADQVPAELYERYTALRARYLPEVEDDDEEQRRVLAALTLYTAALVDTGLMGASDVDKMIKRKMRRSRAEDAEVVVKREPEAVFDELAKITPEAELACFASILTSMATDLSGMKERANAWAIGDVEALKRFDYPDVWKETVSKHCSRPPRVSSRFVTSSTRSGSPKPSTRSRPTTRRSRCCRCGSSSPATACLRNSRLAARGYTVIAP